MKSDKPIRLLKTVPAVQVRFQDGQVPELTQIVGSFYDLSNWTVLNATGTSPPGQGIELVYEDSIDISGLTVNEISLINQGGAIAHCHSPICTFPEIASMRVTTYVSVNPVRGSFVERSLFGNSLAAPSESQDWFLASTQEYMRNTTTGGVMQKIGEHNWGTGGIASSSRLFIKVFVRMDRAAIYVPALPPGVSDFVPFTAVGDIITSPMTIGIMAVTAEMDAVQTAAAIYRGNDLQQTYDES